MPAGRSSDSSTEREPFSSQDTREVQGRDDGQELGEDLYVGRRRRESDSDSSSLGYACLREPRRPKHIPRNAPYWNPKF